MSVFLILAFLFFLGSVLGWGLELFYRNARRGKGEKWVNPGFCSGPYVPLYGFGLCALYLLASLEQFSLTGHPVWNKVCLFAAMALAMTAIEYAAGILCLKVLKVRLWDYSQRWGNVQGIICPLFSFYWAVLGAVYYFLIHPHILEALEWLSRNLAFSFFVGLFFGVFLMDVAGSAQLMAKLKRFADENQVVVKYESIKAHIRKTTPHHVFFRPFHSDRPLNKHLREMRNSFETRIKKRK